MTDLSTLGDHPEPRLSRAQADQLAADLRALQQVEDMIALITHDDVGPARLKLGTFIASRTAVLTPLSLALGGDIYPQDLLERLGGAAFEGARSAMTRERKAIAARLAQWVEVQA